MVRKWVAGSFLALCTLTPLAAQPKGTSTKEQPKLSLVPFVGCKSDGQMGPVAAPKGKLVAIPARSASRLAYYKSDFGVGVLAPQGWHCFCTYGSNGSSLFVSPRPFGSAELFSTQWNGFDGPAIQISAMFGDTSGRFSVARMIARVFPAHLSFVKSVIDEGIEPASDFPSGPYPSDKLTYLTNEMVEYQTPANADGLGTHSLLIKNGDPIRGVVILFDDALNLLHLHVRLPPELESLAPIIIRQAERDASRH